MVFINERQKNYKMYKILIMILTKWFWGFAYIDFSNKLFTDHFLMEQTKECSTIKGNPIFFLVYSIVRQKVLVLYNTPFDNRKSQFDTKAKYSSSWGKQLANNHIVRIRLNPTRWSLASWRKVPSMNYQV